MILLNNNIIYLSLKYGYNKNDVIFENAPCHRQLVIRVDILFTYYIIFSFLNIKFLLIFYSIGFYDFAEIKKKTER